MGKLGQDIRIEIGKLVDGSDASLVNIRAHQVRHRYRTALETVYKSQSQLFLDHTNNVYIMDKQGRRTLIVYVDESIFAAELNAQRELIRLKMLELFGEELDDFEILISRGNYRNHHPFNVYESEEEKRVTPEPLDSSEMEYVRNVTDVVENDDVRASLKSAMKANMEWNKGKTKNESSEL